MVLGDDGIIKNAQVAKKAQEKADKTEIALLKENELKVETKGKIQIGDYVTYNASDKTYTLNEKTFTTNSNLKWKYIGADGEGHILLTSDIVDTNNIVKFNGSDGIYKGYEAYEKGPDLIDNVCKELYSGTLGTARSMKIEDVNKILGYTEDKVHFKNSSGVFEWVPYGTTIGDLNITIENLGLGNGKTEKNYKNLLLSQYAYNGATFKETNPKGYDLIFEETSLGLNPTAGVRWYWLADKVIYANATKSKICYKISAVIAGRNSGGDFTAGDDGMTETWYEYPAGPTIWDTKEQNANNVQSMGIRPVIMLNKDVKLTNAKDSNGAWIIGNNN